MIDKQLPSWCHSKHPLQTIDGIIVHYFSAINVEPSDPFDMEVCRDLFLDLNRVKAKREHYLKAKTDPEPRHYASAHVLIGREGEEYKLVPFTRQAYHAGQSVLNGRRHCNNFTLGVELAGTINSGFSDAQYKCLAELSSAMIDLHGFGPEMIVGHDQVRWDAIQAGYTKKKKYDPTGRYDGTGDNFSFEKLRGLIDDIRGQT